MFHLLVSSSGWGEAWREDSGTLDLGRTITTNRTSEHLVAIFRPDGNFNLEEIRKYPALIMPEKGGWGVPVARIGYIYDVKKNGRNALISYHLDPKIDPIQVKQVENLVLQLGLDPFQLSHTHWSVNEKDLFEVLFKNNIGLQPKPVVFNIDPLHNASRNQVSVMMPFSGGFNAVYHAIQTMAVDMGMVCNRADDIWENHNIIQDVVSLICRSSVVICDLSDRNPNVFYEAGIAHALGKEVVLIVQNPADVPFDLRHLRYINYLANNEGIENLIERLRPRVSQLTGGQYH